MAHDKSKLERLSSALVQCLSRIDEEAFRLQDLVGDHFDFEEVERIEIATDELQGLFDSLLVVETSDEKAFVNEILTKAAADCLLDLGVPVVQSQNLCEQAAVVVGSPTLVTSALRSAVLMAAEPLMPGGHLGLTTRAAQGNVIVEIEGLGGQTGESVADQSEGLRELVVELGGTCTVYSERGDRYLVLELPQVMVTDSSDRV